MAADDGSFVVSGTFAGTVDFDPSTAKSERTAVGLPDLFVARFSVDNALLWVVTFGSNEPRDAAASSALILSPNDNSVWVAGNFSGSLFEEPVLGSAATLLTVGSAPSLGESGFVIKLSINGRRLFTRTVLLTAERTGESANVAVTGMAGDEVGNVAVLGTLTGGADFNPQGGGDQKIVATLNGAGTFVSHYSDVGERRWTRLFNSVGTFQSNAIAVDRTSLYVSARLAKGGTVVLDDADPTTTVQPPEGGSNYLSLVIRLDRGGEYARHWVWSGPGVAFSWISALAVARDGSIFASGVTYDGSLDVDPGPATVLRQSLGNTDGFVVKLDASGSYLADYTVFGTGSETVTALAVHADGTLIGAGEFSSPVSFLSNEAPRPPSGKGWFIARWRADLRPLWVGTFSSSDAISPTGVGVSAAGFICVGTFRASSDFDPTSAMDIMMPSAKDRSAGFFVRYSL